MVARTKRSPGFGPSLAFPVPQWPMSEVDCPLQWRGRAGIAPASERPHSRNFNCPGAQVYRLLSRAASEASSWALSLARSA